MDRWVTKGVGPQMQSSGMVALRALVMLAFLIVVPLVATFGTALPEVVRGLIDGHAATRGRPLQDPLPVATINHQGGGHSRPAAQPPLVYESDSQTASSHGPAGAIEPHSLLRSRPTSMTGETVPIAYEQPLPPDNRVAPPDPDPNAAPHPEPMNYDVHPTVDEFQTPATGEIDRAQFASIEQRLQQLGATSYRLESWGGQGQMYRFQCLMEMSYETQNRHFQSTATSAEAAMSDVLGQVERWRGVSSEPARP